MQNHAKDHEIILILMQSYTVFYAAHASNQLPYPSLANVLSSGQAGGLREPGSVRNSAFWLVSPSRESSSTATLWCSGFGQNQERGSMIPAVSIFNLDEMTT